MGKHSKIINSKPSSLDGPEYRLSPGPVYMAADNMVVGPGPEAIFR